VRVRKEWWWDQSWKVERRKGRGETKEGTNSETGAKLGFQGKGVKEEELKASPRARHLNRFLDNKKR